MAVSRVGSGWPVAERDYLTLANWYSAKLGSTEFEDAVCKGDLGSAFVTIAATALPGGYHIHSDVIYDGTNKDDLAVYPRRLRLENTSGNGVVSDLYIRHTSGAQDSVGCQHGNLVIRCYITHSGSAGSNSAIALATNGGIFKNCIIVAEVPDNNFGARTTGANGGEFEQCVSIGSVNGFYTNFNNASSIFKSNFAVANSTDFFFPNGTPVNVENNASQDDTGQHTGYTAAEFVDAANGDYRIKSGSDLAALNIGAFFDSAPPGEDQIYTTSGVVLSVCSDQVGTQKINEQIFAGSGILLSAVSASLASNVIAEQVFNSSAIISAVNSGHASTAVINDQAGEQIITASGVMYGVAYTQLAHCITNEQFISTSPVLHATTVGVLSSRVINRGNIELAPDRMTATRVVPLVSGSRLTSNISVQRA